MKCWFLLVIIGIGAPLSARAQVSVNPAALAQLAGLPPVSASAPAARRPALVVHHPRHTPRIIPNHHKAAVIVAMAHPAPATPISPPPAKPIVLAPLSVIFAPGSAALPQGAPVALRPFCHAAQYIRIDAHAPPGADGASGAMRLSLARAMAVRDALAACGAAPTLLLPRALGSLAGADNNVTTISSGPQK
ncbi:MAG: hypothetical protein POH28_05855 [Acidocella sp.]|nr:hypothetical protein [Acidocella sp.]